MLAKLTIWARPAGNHSLVEKNTRVRPIRGSLLIEIVISGLLLFVGGLAILRTFAPSYRYATLTEHQLEAHRLGLGILSQLQSMPSTDRKGLDELRQYKVTLEGLNENSPTSVTYRVRDISFRYGGGMPARERTGDVATVVIAWNESQLSVSGNVP